MDEAELAADGDVLRRLVGKGKVEIKPPSFHIELRMADKQCLQAQPREREVQDRPYESRGVFVARKTLADLVRTNHRAPAGSTMRAGNSRTA